MQWFDTAYSYTPTLSTWEDTDLSPHIPVGATFAIIEYQNIQASIVNVGARIHNGSDTLFRPIYFNSHAQLIVPLDSNRHIDLYRSSSFTTFYLRGYLETADAVQLSPIDKTPAIAGSYQTITCSEVPNGTKFAIFRVSPNTGYANGIYLRGYNATIDRYQTSGTGYYSAIIPLDSSKRCSCKVESNIVDQIWLVGYISSGWSVATDANDVSLTSIGSYLSKAVTYSGSATLAIIEPYDVTGGFTTSGCGFRNSVSSEDLSYNIYYYGGTFLAPINSGNITARIDDLDVDFFQWGYLEPSNIPPTANFSGTPTSGNAPLTVNFTDLSSGTPTYWEWSYHKQGGSPLYTVFSYNQSPSFEFTQNGVYDIALTVSNAYGYDAEIKIGYITVQNVGTVNVTLPLLSPLASSDGIVQTLPMFQIGAGGYWTDFVKATLPLFEINAFAQILSNDIIQTLPMLTISASGSVGIVGNLIATLPIFTIDASDAISGNLSVDLPLLQILAIGGSTIIGESILTLPRLGFSGIGLTGEVGTVNVTLPKFTISSIGTVILGITGQAYIILPKFTISTSGIITVIDTYTVYAINMKNAAISKYLNYNFDSFAKFGNLYLASSPTGGIYTLTGSDDDGTVINSKITTGKLAMGVDKIKRIVDFFLNLKAYGGYDLKMSTDDGVEHIYSITDTNGEVHPIRVKAGKGKKGKFWTFKFLNKAGEDFELESIDIDVETLSRKS